MKIRIIYGSNSGSTRAASELMQQFFVKSGHIVVIQGALETVLEDLTGSDLTIIGSCSWDRFEGKERFHGQLQQHWFELQNRIGTKKFLGQKFAIFGVGDSTYTHFCGAADELESLLQNWQGTQVGQTLRLDSYFFEPERCEREIQAWVRTLKI